MRKDIIFTLFLLFVFVNKTLGQLTGKLLDAKGEAVAYANVAVLQGKDSVAVTGALTEASGRFIIATPAGGTYLLHVRAIGYVPVYVGPFHIKDSREAKDFGTLPLDEEAMALREVTVNALRPAVLVEADKLVVSVEGTALAAGSSAYQLLERAPGVWIDQEGNMQLNGKAGVRVLLDGRPSYLSGKELLSMLASMSAENVKDIELIANPTAKYEASGGAGIINIRLKQSMHQGMNGNVSGGYQYNKASGYNTGANMNYKNGRWNSFVNADVAKRPRLREGLMVREFHEGGANARFHQLRNEHMTTNTVSLRLGTDYELNARHQVGGVINLSQSTTDRAFYSDTDMDDRGNNTHTFVTAGNFNDVTNRSKAVNLHYNGQLDTSGTRLSVHADYVRLKNNNEARYENSFLDVRAGARREELLKTFNPGYYDIYATNVDFEASLWAKTKVEAGLKASHVISGSDLRFYEVDPEQQAPARLVLDESRSNAYRYTESIFAGYVNMSAPLNEKWSLQAGLRGEQTLGKGKPGGDEKPLVKHYLDLFPSLFLSHKITSGYQVNYTYSRRIDRPNYRALNPFIFYQDPFSWAEGNPDLKPQYTTTFQVIQTLRNTYSLVLGYAHTEDFFAEVPQQDAETNTTVYQERNIDKSDNFSATLIAPFHILSGWEVSNNVVAGHQQNQVLLQGQTLSNKQFYLTAQSTHQVLLPRLGVQLQAVVGYSSPATYGVYTFKTQWWMDTGLTKSLLDDKLDVTLSATDLFKSRAARGDASYHGNVFTFKNYFMVQSIKVNLRYSFQRGLGFKSGNRSTKLEELNRAGGQ